MTTAATAFLAFAAAAVLVAGAAAQSSPDQAAMDTFVKAFTYTGSTPPWNPTGKTDCCQWANVQCTFGRVTQISFDELELSGHIDLTGLPSKLQSLSASSNAGLSGPIDLSALPSTLQVLNLQENKFDGPLLLDTLPASLQTLKLGMNQFSAPVTLDSLPANLGTLDLSNNQLSGSVSLKTLPKSLVDLSLNNNKFTSGLDVDPSAQLKYLSVDSNPSMAGQIDFATLPTTLLKFTFSQTKLCGTAKASIPCYRMKPHVGCAAPNYFGKQCDITCPC